VLWTYVKHLVRAGQPGLIDRLTMNHGAGSFRCGRYVCDQLHIRQMSCCKPYEARFCSSSRCLGLPIDR